jgi:hypothetical protein
MARAVSLKVCTHSTLDGPGRSKPSLPLIVTIAFVRVKYQLSAPHILIRRQTVKKQLTRTQRQRNVGRQDFLKVMFANNG